MPEHTTPLPGSIETQLLIVDDESHIRSALGQTLNLLGYSIVEAGSGQEALTLLEHGSYDLMLLDNQMPDIDGIDVIRHARQLHPELSIIILTSYATLDSAVAAVKLDVADYLLKPVDIEQVVNTVTRTLQKRAEQLHQRHLMRVISEATDALPQIETPSSASSASGTPSERFIYAHPLTLDRRTRLVLIEDDLSCPLELTGRETAVLGSLMAHPDQVLSCSQLVQVAWGYDMGESDAQNLIRPYISCLRRKIGGVLEKKQLIRTVRKQGYLYSSSHPV